MKALKFGISSIMCGITSTLFKSHVWFHEKWFGWKILFMQFYAPTAKWRINVVMLVLHYQERRKHLFEDVFYHKQRPKTKHVLTFVVFSTIIKLNVESWRQEFS